MPFYCARHWETSNKQGTILGQIHWDPSGPHPSQRIRWIPSGLMSLSTSITRKSRYAAIHWHLSSYPSHLDSPLSSSTGVSGLSRSDRRKMPLSRYATVQVRKDVPEVMPYCFLLLRPWPLGQRDRDALSQHSLYQEKPLQAPTLLQPSCPIPCLDFNSSPVPGNSFHYCLLAMQEGAPGQWPISYDFVNSK